MEALNDSRSLLSSCVILVRFSLSSSEEVNFECSSAKFCSSETRLASVWVSLPSKARLSDTSVQRAL